MEGKGEFPKEPNALREAISNSQEYECYFDTLRHNDAPMQAIDSFNIKALLELPKREEVPHADPAFRKLGIVTLKPIENPEVAVRVKAENIKGQLAALEVLRKIYEGIDLEGQEEHTGRSIIAATKPLVAEYCSLYISTAQRVLQDPAFVPDADLVQKLNELRLRISENAAAYGNLPAVAAYGNWDKKNYGGLSRDAWFAAGKP
jgi:hypothetical protein